MNKQATAYTIKLEPSDARRLANLCGQFNQHIKQIEERLAVEISHRGNSFSCYGEDKPVRAASALLTRLYRETDNGNDLTPDDIHLFLQSSQIDKLISENEDPEPEDRSNVSTMGIIHTKKMTVKPRGYNQQRYVRAIQDCDINFGIGPAGTGKTFLAVACAVEALLQDRVERLILVRPAVEAGEKLGFLPGDLTQKVDPYLRPLYDALYAMLGFDTVDKLLEKNVIEIAPLAFMRGRTLNNAFIILDESQNTTCAQMKMFLTRLGFGATAVINGDATQVDLPKGTKSGLLHASKILQGIDDVSFTHFTSHDVVRHPLVQRIVEAYDALDDDNK